jgi:probable rRNA maturation factor
MASINFFTEDINFELPHPRKISNWIKKVVPKERNRINQLNFIFCSDEYLIGLNIKYLSHKTYTDIITFDSREKPGPLEGEIFISVTRVKENASELGVPFLVELHRVIIHGVLHLIGYSDKTTREKLIMRKKEDAYLSLLNN